MALLHCGIALLAVSAGIVPSHPTSNVGHRLDHAQPAVAYTAQQAEFYLSPEQTAWIRPGLNVKLNSLTNVAPGQKPVVDVTFTDDFGQPLDYAGKATPGPVSISFILAKWNPTTRLYTSLTMRTRSGRTTPAADQAPPGAWNHIEPGHSKYTFGTVMPADLDLTKTYTLGIYGRRTMTAIVGKDYYMDNINYNFRPDGQPVVDKWDDMDVANTCNKCHDPLGLHGGTRRTVNNCVLCHTPQIPPDATTGQPFDFKVMVHRIHSGANLPSVLAGGKYIIAGLDFSTLGMPQDVRNCTTCHATTKADGKTPNTDGAVWFTRPSRAACGSCHDDVNFATGEKHGAVGPLADDSACASCHKPEGEAEWDVSIKNAHVVPTKSAQLKGLNVAISAITNTAPGQTPTVTFKVTNNDGSVVDVTKLTTCNLLLGGPTTDYSSYFRESGKTATPSGDSWVFTFKTPIPADATGTWTIAADVYRTITLSPAPRKLTTPTVREAAQNPILNFVVTDKQTVARRKAVDLVKCNKCHETLALHGGQRFKTEECVICHTPLESDKSQRPADKGAVESVHLKRMIHRIHTGDELLRDYTIYGNGKRPVNFNEVRYPGDRRDCQQCHVAGSYGVPTPEGSLATPTPSDWYSPMQPDAAACLGCHDSKQTAAHAYVNTAPFGEACAACHGKGLEFDVEKVHAR